MESEIEQLRSKREYYTRRLNVTCPLTPAQAAAATAFVSRVRACATLEAEAELVRHRFVWEGMAHGEAVIKTAQQFKQELLDAIEEAAPLRNPCHECYQKSPEAKAEKRKAQEMAGRSVEGGSTAAAAAKAKPSKAKRVKLATELPAVTSNNTTVGCTLPDA